MTIIVEGTHISLLRYIMGKRVQINTDRMQATPLAREVLRVAVMQTAATYIGRSQGTVAQWVDLRPIFEVYTQDPGLKG